MELQCPERLFYSYFWDLIYLDSVGPSVACVFVAIIRIIYVEAPMQLRFWLTIIVHFYNSVLSVT